MPWDQAADMAASQAADAGLPREMLITDVLARFLERMSLAAQLKPEMAVDDSLEPPSMTLTAMTVDFLATPWVSPAIMPATWLGRC